MSKYILLLLFSIYCDLALADGIIPQWMRRSKPSEASAAQPAQVTPDRNYEYEKIEQEKRALAEERQKLNEEKVRREAAKQSKKIQLRVAKTEPDENGEFVLSIETGADTSSLKINDEELGGRSDGKYTVRKIARVGQETVLKIVAKDTNSNQEVQTVSIFRKAVEAKTNTAFLDPSKIKKKPSTDAVAIIIGIEKYKRITKADFANSDAQDFYDYSIRALGIKPENIKLLVDDGADDVEILGAFKNWLPLKIKKNTTDVYVFYSGHGLPSEDGKSLYFLPFGTETNFIERTAINQQEIIASIQNAKPRNVTMFIDSCYSGQTRGGDTLLASARPISLKSVANAYPDNFTVISASAPDQLSSSSPDLKHGIFSFYLMKGMEGDADLNSDKKISVGEMQEYLTDMVGRQAMALNRKQFPQLFGDPNRILFSRE